MSGALVVPGTGCKIGGSEGYRGLLAGGQTRIWQGVRSSICMTTPGLLHETTSLPMLLILPNVKVADIQRYLANVPALDPRRYLSAHIPRPSAEYISSAVLYSTGVLSSNGAGGNGRHRSVLLVLFVLSGLGRASKEPEEPEKRKPDERRLVSYDDGPSICQATGSCFPCFFAESLGTWFRTARVWLPPFDDRSAGPLRWRGGGRSSM